MNKNYTIINISDLEKKYILKNNQSLEIIKNLNLKRLFYQASIYICLTRINSKKSNLKSRNDLRKSLE